MKAGSDRTAEGLAQTEKELRAEKAAALARIAGTLESLLAGLFRHEEVDRHYPPPGPLP